jgi:hypothetical protein
MLLSKMAAIHHLFLNLTLTDDSTLLSRGLDTLHRMAMVANGRSRPGSVLGHGTRQCLDGDLLNGMTGRETGKINHRIYR